MLQTNSRYLETKSNKILLWNICYIPYSKTKVQGLSKELPKKIYNNKTGAQVLEGQPQHFKYIRPAVMKFFSISLEEF